MGRLATELAEGLRVAAVLRCVADELVEQPLADVAGLVCRELSPVRRAASYTRQIFRAQDVWTATTGGHVACESMAEADWVRVLDLTPDVVDMAAQPLRINWESERASGWHVPDLLVELHGGGRVLIDVAGIPADQTARRLAGLIAARELCAGCEWGYLVLDGGPSLPVALNARAVVAARRPLVLDPGVDAALGELLRERKCMLMQEGEARFGQAARSAALRLIATGVAECDLTTLLGPYTLLTATAT